MAGRHAQLITDEASSWSLDNSYISRSRGRLPPVSARRARAIGLTRLIDPSHQNKREGSSGADCRPDPRFSQIIVSTREGVWPSLKYLCTGLVCGRLRDLRGAFCCVR